MKKTCIQCSAPFEISDDDLKFYEKISPEFGGKKYLVPPPTLCPDCRKQRRLAFRNERNLYHRKCDLTGKQIISAFSPGKPYKVYRQHDWWGDEWEALTYGSNIDFQRPFFHQFNELFLRVPHMNLAAANCENSDYCHLVADCRNCYLVFESSNNEDCLYGYWIQKCKNCTETSFSHESQWCYDVDNCYNCYHLFWSCNCTNCAESLFLFDCIGCKNCLFCMNLRQKEYCIFNKQYTKEEFEREIQKYDFGSYSGYIRMKEAFNAFKRMQPHRACNFVNVENCTGDYIQESKDCHECFHAHIAEHCKYGEHVWRNSKFNMDVSTVGRDAELVYEAINTGIGVYHMLFSIQCWNSDKDLIYCYDCFGSSRCFGCIGLRQKEYCILNMQYSKEEYEQLVPKTIEHMRKTGEWGEFFPVSISPFGYNETVAGDYFPLGEKEVQQRGWKWHQEEQKKESYMGPSFEIPDRIQDVDNEICEKILRCSVTGRPYKIIPQELTYHQKMSIPLPRICPDQRHRDRIHLRNPQKLWDRACTKCKKTMKTTYAPDRPEIVYCESCYLTSIY